MNRWRETEARLNEQHLLSLVRQARHRGLESSRAVSDLLYETGIGQEKSESWDVWRLELSWYDEVNFQVIKQALQRICYQNNLFHGWLWHILSFGILSLLSCLHPQDLIRQVAAVRSVLPPNNYG